MINNEINFLDLKIQLNNKNKLIFVIYDKITYFPFTVNTFTHHDPCLHKSAYKISLLIYVLMYAQIRIKIQTINL